MLLNPLFSHQWQLVPLSTSIGIVIVDSFYCLSRERIVKSETSGALSILFFFPPPSWGFSWRVIMMLATHCHTDRWWSADVVNIMQTRADISYRTEEPVDPFDPWKFWQPPHCSSKLSRCRWHVSILLTSNIVIAPLSLHWSSPFMNNTAWYPDFQCHEHTQVRDEGSFRGTRGDPLLCRVDSGIASRCRYHPSQSHKLGGCCHNESMTQQQWRFLGPPNFKGFFLL